MATQNYINEYKKSIIENNSEIYKCLGQCIKEEKKFRENDFKTSTDNLYGLINVYDNYEIFKNIKLTEKELDFFNENHSKILFLNKHYEKMNSRIDVISTKDEFERNLDVFTNYAFANMNWNNILIAGGSILAMLSKIPDEFSVNDTKIFEWYEKEYKSSDIDIFFYGLSDKDATKKLIEIYENIKKIVGNDIKCLRSTKAITILLPYPYRHIQLILKNHKTIAEILLSFDVDCSMFGYDGNNIYCSPRAHHAITHLLNFVDLDYRSPSYEYRLAKYGERGFGVLVNNYDDSNLNDQIFLKKPSQITGLARLVILEKLNDNKKHEIYRDILDKHMATPRRNIDETQDYVDSDYSPVFLQRDKNTSINDIINVMNEKNKKLNENAKYIKNICSIGTIYNVIKSNGIELPNIKDEKELKYLKDNYVYGKIKWHHWETNIGSFQRIMTPESEWYNDVFVNNNVQEFCDFIINKKYNDIKKKLNEIKTKSIKKFKRDYRDNIEPISFLLNSKDISNRNPLQLAIQLGKIKLVKLFLKRGANPLYVSKLGKTALHSACEYGNIEIFDVIYNVVSKMENINPMMIKDSYWLTPPLYALIYNKNELFLHILKNNYIKMSDIVWIYKFDKLKSYRALELCLLYRNYDLAIELLKIGYDINDFVLKDMDKKSVPLSTHIIGKSIINYNIEFLKILMQYQNLFKIEEIIKFGYEKLNELFKYKFTLHKLRDVDKDYYLDFVMYFHKLDKHHKIDFSNLFEKIINFTLDECIKKENFDESCYFRKIIEKYNIPINNALMEKLLDNYVKNKKEYNILLHKQNKINIEKKIITKYWAPTIDILEKLENGEFAWLVSLTNMDKIHMSSYIICNYDDGKSNDITKCVAKLNFIKQIIDYIKNKIKNINYYCIAQFYETKYNTENIYKDNLIKIAFVDIKNTIVSSQEDYIHFFDLIRNNNTLDDFNFNNINLDVKLIGTEINAYNFSLLCNNLNAFNKIMEIREKFAIKEIINKKLKKVKKLDNVKLIKKIKYPDEYDDDGIDEKTKLYNEREEKQKELYLNDFNFFKNLIKFTLKCDEKKNIFEYIILNVKINGKFINELKAYEYCSLFWTIIDCLILNKKYVNLRIWLNYYTSTLCNKEKPGLGSIIKYCVNYNYKNYQYTKKSYYLRLSNNIKDLEILKIFIEEFKDVDEFKLNIDYVFTLNKKIDNNYINHLRKILTIYPEFINQKYNGETLIIKAIKNHEIELIKLLLEFNVDINIASDEGLYPIHYTINSTYQIYKIIQEYGANINQQTIGKQQTPLMLCIKNYSKLITDDLIASHVDQTLTDVFGNTALHYTAMFHNLYVLEKLDIHEKENYFRMTAKDYIKNNMKGLFHHIRNKKVKVNRNDLSFIAEMYNKFFKNDNIRLHSSIENVKNIQKYIFNNLKDGIKKLPQELIP